MSLFNSAKPLIQICRFCGLAPFYRDQFKMKWKSKLALKYVSIVVIALNGIFFLAAIVFIDQFVNHEKSPVYTCFMAAFFILNLLHAMFALLELFIKRDQQLELLNTFEELDIYFRQHFNMNVNYRALKKKCLQIMIVWVCEIVCTLVPDILASIEINDVENLWSFSIFYYAHILSRLSYAYSLIFVVCVRESLDVLNKHLKGITKQNGYYICDTFLSQKSHSKCKKRNFFKATQTNLNLDTLEFMMRAYCKIWKASLSISRLSQWSLAFGILYIDFSLVFGTYNIVTSVFFDSDYSISYQLYTLILLSTDLGNILFISYNCRKATETVSKQENVNTWQTLKLLWEFFFFRRIFSNLISITFQ